MNTPLITIVSVVTMKYYKHADGEPLCLAGNPMDDMGENLIT